MKISALTVFNVLSDLKKTNETFSSVASRYRISNTAVTYIFDAHISVSRRILPEYICIDEVYAITNQDSEYVCILVDFLTGNVIDILPSRKKLDLLTYFRSISRSEREKVKIVCMDMWNTYRLVVKDIFPNASSAIYKFHIYQEYTRLLTDVRIRAMNFVKPKALGNNPSIDENMNTLKKINNITY